MHVGTRMDTSVRGNLVMRKLTKTLLSASQVRIENAFLSLLMQMSWQYATEYFERIGITILLLTALV